MHSNRVSFTIVNLANSSPSPRALSPSVDYIITGAVAGLLTIKYIFLDTDELDEALLSSRNSSAQPLACLATPDGEEPITQEEHNVTQWEGKEQPAPGRYRHTCWVS